MDIQMLSNIYVSRNVVGLHLSEFLERATERHFLEPGEQILAIFDCIIMETGGIRIGGLTLHDYAIVTNQHLFTWARGRSKDVIDKFRWAYLSIDKFGRRNTIEGTVKLIYRAPAAGGRRQIALRSRMDKENPLPEKPREEQAPKTEGVAIYLDFMPVEEVPVCQRMLNFFISNTFEEPGIDAFLSTFRSELEASTNRLLAASAGVRAAANRQANRVYLEPGYSDEDQLLEPAQTPSNWNGSPYRGFSSPYQLKASGQATPAAPPARVDANRSRPYNAASKSNTPLKGGSVSRQGFSKLDAFEFNSAYQPASFEAPPAPKPVPEKTLPVPVDKPVARPTLPAKEPVTLPEIVEVSSESESNDPSTIQLSPRVDPSNIYAISRIAHGLLEGRQNFGRNIADVSETAAILASLPGLLSDDAQTRQASIFKLRTVFEGGYMENNTLLNRALMPLVQSFVSRAIPSQPRPAHKPNRLSVRVAERVKPLREDVSPALEWPDEFNVELETDPFADSGDNMIMAEPGSDLAIAQETATPDEPEIALASVSSESKRIKFSKPAKNLSQEDSKSLN
jgi:hypothetical protein